MISRSPLAFALLVALVLSTIYAADTRAATTTEYSQHFGALRKLSVAVAEAMPPEQYAFRPDPGSMTFGELISHIAATNYAFCAGLQDSNPPQTPSPSDKDKDAVIKFLEAVA